jgi:DNA repair photolyase
MLQEIRVKSVLNKHKYRDDWFLENYTLNPFTGCSFNCVYCYVHGSKYGERVSPGLSVKINSPEVLYRQLKNRARKKEYGIIAVGSATDPYIPQEEKLKMTRELLKIILRFKFPVNITTKSKIILRDIDLLSKIHEKAVLPLDLQETLDGGVIVSFSFSTMDQEMAKVFEPGAPSPINRLETLSKCKDAGFKTGACLMPLLPFLSDSKEHLDFMIGKVKEYGGDFVLPAGLTLFGDKTHDSRVRYFKTVEKYYPGVVLKTKQLFAGNTFPPFRYQQMINKITMELCAKHGIKNRIC